MNGDHSDFRNHVLYSAFCSVKNVRMAAEKCPVSVIEGRKIEEHEISCTLCWPSLKYITGNIEFAFRYSSALMTSRLLTLA